MKIINSEQLNGNPTALYKVSIQGYEGSFHQVAAREFFGNDVEVICCPTFNEALRIAAGKNDCFGGVMAIENSIAGSILGNYNLLRKSELHIVGEVYLEIRQNLLVNRGVQLEDIQEVHSHPMAIQQCLKFLDKFNWKIVEADDTAGSARSIQQQKSKHIAAIASTLAAELYDLDIISPDIHTIRNNFTRFLILKNGGEVLPAEGANKATITFYTDHSIGSLARVLTEIADKKMNLSKLQSFPIPNTDWLYMFGADMEFEAIDQFYELIESLKPLTEEVKIYGIYKKGNTVKF